MAFEENGGGNGLVMPVAPMYGGGNQGNGGWGGDWGWIILLLLLAGGGWGMGGGFGGFGGGLGYDFPWLLNGQQGINNNVSDGFRDQMLQTTIASVGDKVVSGFGDIQTALCGGFAGVNAGIANTAAQAEISANARQMANMQQNFALQSQLSDCCCENRLATESLRATVLSENCADRFEAQNNTRDIISAITSGIQSVKDELCADRLEGYKREADNLRQQLTAANLAASQIAQTSQIVDQTYNRLSSCPVGTVPVFGNQPIWTCASNVANQNNCGCGCGGNF